MNELPAQWLTVREAASYTRCGVKTLYRAIRAGQLKAARVGGQWKVIVRREWLDAYLESCAEGGPRQVLRMVRAA